MKTWIFDEQALDTAIAAWVENQIASGHPKAVANAAFVGIAIKDMLKTSPKLFKQSPAQEQELVGIVPSVSLVEAASNNSDVVREREDTLSIADLKRAWYGK